MSEKKSILYGEFFTKSAEETFALGRKLARELKPGHKVFLYGELGVGKTVFTRGLAQGLGVKEKIKSPTYVYVNLYYLKNGLRLAHFDLYRLSNTADFMSLGLAEIWADPKTISVLEWGDRIQLADFNLQKFAAIRIRSTKEGRKIWLENLLQPEKKNISEKFAQVWIDKYCTPIHVLAHSKMVACVAGVIADCFSQRGIKVDKVLIEQAALLHDLVRVVDFKIFDSDKFPYKVPKKAWTIYEKLRLKYHGRHHANVAAEILGRAGYPRLASVIAAHRFLRIFDSDFKNLGWEEKIVYYADKRVKHDQIVSLKERLSDGRKRNRGLEPEKDIQCSDVVIMKLEKEIFDLIKIKPEEISLLVNSVD